MSFVAGAATGQLYWYTVYWRPWGYSIGSHEEAFLKVPSDLPQLQGWPCYGYGALCIKRHRYDRGEGRVKGYTCYELENGKSTDCLGRHRFKTLEEVLAAYYAKYPIMQEDVVCQKILSNTFP